MEAFIYIEWISPESTLLKIFYINSSQLFIVTSISLIMTVVSTWLSARTLANKLNQQYINWLNYLFTKYLNNHTELHIYTQDKSYIDYTSCYENPLVG
jgi:hypothetical protein